MFRRFILTVVAIAAFAGSQAAAKPFDAVEVARIDEAVAKILETSGVPSASVAVVRDGEIAFVKAYGVQRPGAKEPRSDMLYRVASISKQFTAAAILLLQADGKLSLDDRVEKFIPGITGGDRMTIRHLLTNTAGLRDYWPQGYRIPALAKRVTPQEVVDRWAKGPLDFEPGARNSYTNTGFVVAALIVEKVSGQRFYDFLKSRIFKPLKMQAVDADEPADRLLATGYGRHGLGPVRIEAPQAPGWLVGAGGLAMTAEDVARWNIARINRTLLPAAAWMEQETPLRLTDGTSIDYGLGVGFGTTDGHKFVRHGGGIVGVRTENVVYPEDRAAITVLTNAGFGQARDQIKDAIFEILYPNREAETAGKGEAVETAWVRTLYDQLREGRVDRRVLTENAKYYFTDSVLADYQYGLGSLGEPQRIEATGEPSQANGFISCSYIVNYPGRKVRIATLREPGHAGKVEQFLVVPIS